MAGVGAAGATGGGIFHFVMIKPTHYHSDGYPIMWYRSAIPSNTLAVINALALEARDQKILGPDVDIRLHTFDETNQRIPVRKLVRMIERDGGKGLIALLGVQSNQFPRSMDLARRFRAAAIDVAIGGFHVSGCLAMLKDIPPDIQEAIDLGCSLFAGEAEDGRLGRVIRDAWDGRLESVYNYMNDLPGLDGAPVPYLPAEHLKRTAGTHSSFDCGRGCPYQCSFCTIINVQGRKSRSRTPEDIERLIRENYAQGVDRFILTDDNFARNKDWEPILDRIIHLREVEKYDLKFFIQVDTLCHRIPGFIEKCGRAGIRRVYIGLENINPDNLAVVKKRQNRIVEYRTMLQEWKKIGALIYVGYIIGFPNDTPERILHDIEIVKRELPVDLMEIMMLTPLPGSEDHKVLHEKGVWMHPDMNRYDLYHWTVEHPLMSRADYEAVYWEAWKAFHTQEQMETIMRRNAAYGISLGKTLLLLMWFYTSALIEDVHPVESGYLRLKYRTERRPDMPRESMLAFYPKYAWETLSKHVRLVAMIARMGLIYRRLKRDPNRRAYSDMAITPATDAELDELGLFHETRGGEAAVAKKRKADKARDATHPAVAAE
ncbi:B12-binding domain-containing radical SAM protein [Oceanibacterium hippocampi]|uniref:Ribosomal protein S12 methylthiotransferase RimO n=1 Tax=Oceanibacterium hippocampi TaxID=745714 RepID=A0A1Y5TUY5_9PROT|nr:radical SAM protein [Oceanibacterium hippocampi]SLN73720.1 Ribosomal protein S12 methylthiotransferase RimO [Oceanibacterium hippocampi]